MNLSTLPNPGPAVTADTGAMPVNYAFARRHRVLPERATTPGQGWAVWHVEAPPPPVLIELYRVLGQRFELQQMPEAEFERRLARAYDSGTQDAMARVGELSAEADLSSVARELAEPADLLETQDDAPIIRLLNALLTEAIREGASDIHIEPFEQRLAVRLRVDGTLREILEPPRQIAPFLASRIKVMANLDIAEKRLPQDGRISLRVAGRPVDVRVSTLPSGHGERVVLRLLDKERGRLNLNALGMEPGLRSRLVELVHRPNGILLVTGPTGSGKTTTLYAALSEINDRSRSVLTVEDPIEYFLDGIGQTQVNTKVDLTFARGLRAILRQDPDVVMVGEIRDRETAEIAVQASLTGHLVLSTLHTNSAVGAITRLRDMGVEPFLLASSLIGVLAQRLVRRIRPECREFYEADEAEARRLGLEWKKKHPPRLCRPLESCAAQVYSGRFGLYELVSVDAELARMIHDGSAEARMEQHARKHSLSLLDDGVARIQSGQTSVEEVLRVTREMAEEL